MAGCDEEVVGDVRFGRVGRRVRDWCKMTKMKKIRPTQKAIPDIERIRVIDIARRRMVGPGDPCDVRIPILKRCAEGDQESTI